MRFVFRVDASSIIGAGHLYRCLTLGDHLAAMGHEVFMVSRKTPGDCHHLVEASQCKLLSLPLSNSLSSHDKPSASQIALGESVEVDVSQTIECIKPLGVVDWLVIDNYAIDEVWENGIKPYCNNLMVIDDLANRKHICKLLLDQNLLPLKEQRYSELVPNDSVSLLGSNYALLRDEFKVIREQAQDQSESLDKILIFFGGADLHNETLKAIEATKAFARLTIVVICGGANPNYDLIRRELLNYQNYHLVKDTQEIAKYIFDADLIIGACGSTTWERACLGKAALVTTLAANQVPIALHCDKMGLIDYLGHYTEVTISNYQSKIQYYMDTPQKLNQLSNTAYKTVDGNGVGRVIEKLLELS